VRTAITIAVCAIGCTEAAPEQVDTSTVDQSATVCGSGTTVKGIDVSTYQGTINWTSVKADGVVYAMIRVSDGLNSPDAKFAANWSGSRAAGVIHGAYQYFEPGQDPIAQADMLLAKMGDFKADDLPPTLDVEATGGLAPAAVATNVKKWLAHVKAAVGRDPIVYTGFYFWRDSVGGADVLPSVLFHAQYTTAACPNIAAPWTDWAFWQYTSTGTVNGITGSVDTDRWNGTKAQLMAFLGPAGACGDGTCDAGESPISCPEDCGPCATIDATGGEVDDGDVCFVQGGPTDFMRHVSTAGEEGDLIWTHATSDAAEANYGEWSLFFAAAGHYKVEVYTAAAFAQSKQAKYTIHTATSDETATIDQSAVDGWQTLGEYDFAAGGHQWLHLGDNTGEAVADNVQLVFDGVRLTPTDGNAGSGSDTGGGDDGGAADPQHSGCNAGGGGGLGVIVVLGGLLRRRRSS
jgi:lysozyme